MHDENSGLVLKVSQRRIFCSMALYSQNVFRHFYASRFRTSAFMYANVSCID